MPFVPSNLFKRTKTSETVNDVLHNYYELVSKPFNDSTLGWDYNNWLTWSGNKTTVYMNLSVQVPKTLEAEKINIYVDVFKNQYPLDRPQSFLFYDNSAGYICIPFPEFPLKSTIDSISSNRYY